MYKNVDGHAVVYMCVDVQFHLAYMRYTSNSTLHYHQHRNSYLNILLSTCNISECGV